MTPSIDMLRSEYQTLFETCTIVPGRQPTVDQVVATVQKNRKRYEAVHAGTVPWFVVGIIHSLEGGSNFSRHLHNGDPLTARTVHVPAGRPPLPATPPFTWEESAADALTFDGLAAWTEWTVTGILFRLERFNGFGYRAGSGRPIPTPYLWSFSSHYTKGKFSADGRFDPNLVSSQVGGAVLLSELVRIGAIDELPMRPIVASVATDVSSATIGASS